MVPRKRRSVASRNKIGKLRRREQRALQTEEERARTNAISAKRQARKRASRTDEERARDNAQAAQRMAQKRASQTKEQRILCNAQAAQRQAQKRASQEIMLLHRAERMFTRREQRSRFESGELTSTANQNNTDVQSLMQIKRLKVSAMSLKRAGLELIKSCVQSAVTAKYGGKVEETAEQKRRKLQKPTVGRIFKGQRRNRDSTNKEMFPVPVLMDSKIFICIVCNNELNSMLSVTYHFTTHTASELFEAREKYMCSTSKDPRKIKMRYMMLTIHKCELCENQYKNLNSFKKHLIDKHRENRELLEKHCFPCKFCDEISVSKTLFMLHQRNFHQIFTKCPICNLNVETQELFAKHLDEMHSNCLKKDEMVLEYDDGFFCKICGLSSTSVRVVSSHFEETHSENKNNVSHPCPVCNLKYDTKKFLSRHMHKVHEEKSFCCELCGKQFQSGQKLKYHRQKHTTQPEDTRKIDCKLCGKTLANRATYRVHHMAVHEKKKFACNICGKTFTTSANVSYHKTLVCEKEKAIPKSCPICGKVFDNYIFLIHHKANIHKYGNTEENFCHLCKRTYKDTLALYNHNKARHGITIYKNKSIQLMCVICQKPFGSKKALFEHWLMHKEEKLYKCNLCNKTFRYPYQFYAHRKGDHQDEIESAKLITDTEAEHKIKEDWEKAHATQFAELNNRIREARSAALQPHNNTSTDSNNLSVNGNKNGDSAIVTDNLASNKIVSRQSSDATVEDNCKNYVDFSRANVPEVRPLVNDMVPENCGVISTEANNENDVELIPSLETDAQEIEPLDYDFSGPPSPMEHSDNESVAKSKRTAIFDLQGDPFGKRLIVRVERLKGKDWKNADVSHVGKLKNRITESGAAAETHKNISGHPYNLAVTRIICTQTGNSSISISDNLENNSIVAEQEQLWDGTGNVNSEKIVECLRANILESYENEMLDAGDYAAPSPTEYFESDFAEQDIKPDIIYEDPFEKRLKVKVEKLKECLVCDKYFSEPDIYKSHIVSKSHRAAMRAKKRSAIFVAKNEKKKRKQKNESLLTSHKKEANKVVSCHFCNEKLTDIEQYKQHSLQHRKRAHCLLCTERLPSIQELVDHHKKEHDGKNIVKCEVCDESFLEYQKQHLQEHMKDVHEQNTPETNNDIILRSCDICGKRTRNSKALWNHLLSHNDDKFKCVNCEEELKSLTELEYHYNKTHNGEMPFPCENNCPQKFCTQFQLHVHKKENHSKEKFRISQKKKKTRRKERFACAFCNEKFSSISKYLLHSSEHKKGENADCLLCADKFHRVRRLVDHYISKHDGENIVKCKVCDKGFLAYRRRSLREHMSITHGRKYKKKLNVFHSCDICGEKINSHKLLSLHLLSHNETKYKCVYCSEEFNQIELESHYKEAHSGEIPFSCGECQQKFSTQERLQLHEKKFHPKERNDQIIQAKVREIKFTCDECGKGFKKNQELTRHKASHAPPEDRQKFFCEYCGKSFLKSQSLTIHVREHTGERPYPCTVCDKAFVSYDILKLHIDSAHNTISYTCDLCGKSVKTRKNLTRHMKAFHSAGGKNLFSCELCPEVFLKPETLKKHLEIQHDSSRPFACDKCSCRFNHQSNLSYHRKRIHEKTGTVYPKKKKVDK